MSDKKEINKEELNKINGGTLFDSIESIQWRFKKGDKVYISLDPNIPLIEGTITKKGYFEYASYVFGYCDNYYIESVTNPNVNGWYAGSNNYWINENTVMLFGRCVNLNIITVDE